MINFVKIDKYKILEDIALNNLQYEWYDLNLYELISLNTSQDIYYLPIFIKPFDIDFLLTEEIDDSGIQKLSNFIFSHFPKVININFINIKTSQTKILKRKSSVKLKSLIKIAHNKENYFIKFFANIYTIKKKNTKSLLKINDDTKCLMVAPHPDDEIIGAGELLIKYSNNFDCICMGSSGISNNNDMNEAKHKSNIRIQEFNNVMDYIGIKNHWIFETYGTHHRFDKEMEGMLDDYCKVLDLNKYDYIFLPHPKDGHHEHRFITNKLFKKIIKRNGLKENTKIVFYEVWSEMKNPNMFFDTTNQGCLFAKNEFPKFQKSNSKLQIENPLINLKYKVLDLYKSQWENSSPFIVYIMRAKCLNNQKIIWSYKVTDKNKYCKTI